MKKLLFLILFTMVAVKLKAQQKSTEKPLEKVTASNFRFMFDSLALRSRLFIKPNINSDLQFLPKQNLSSNILIASLDNMPIAKPQGRWIMPIAKPDKSTKYNMPVLRGQPIIKSRTDTTRFNP